MIDRSPRRRAALVLLALSALVAAPLAACSSDDDATADATTTTAAPGHGHGSSDAAGDGTYGSSMRPETVTVEQVAALGPGPRVGESWSGSIGLNVCGRFLEPLGASTPSDGSAASGIGTDGTGTFDVSPPSDAASGHAATVGTLLSQAGVQLSTGSVTFPTSVRPEVIEDGAARAEVAGATFTTGYSCGDRPAEIQLWVYTAEAADTGEGIRQVLTDPQDTPIVEDGMAFVVAVSPDSSLPTLPPSALAG